MTDNPLQDTLDTILERGFWNMDPDYDGGCPCSSFTLDGIHFATHCWRVGLCCQYSGLHIWRDNGDTAGLTILGEALLKAENGVCALWAERDEWTLKLDAYHDE